MSIAKQILLFGLLSVATQCVAGELVTASSILEVTNTNGGQEFIVKVSGGSGICVAQQYLIFQRARFASDAAYSQGFAAALTALATDKKITVFNFIDNVCGGGSAITIIK